MGILLSKPDEPSTANKNNGPARGLSVRRKRKKNQQSEDMAIESKSRQKKVKSSQPRTPSSTPGLEALCLNSINVNGNFEKQIRRIDELKFVNSESTNTTSRKKTKSRSKKPSIKRDEDSLDDIPNTSKEPESSGEERGLTMSVLIEATAKKPAQRKRKPPTSSHFDADTPHLASPPATPTPSISEKPLTKKSKISIIETTLMPSSLPHFRPTSPHEFGLIQEKLRHEPWKMLVAVIFLNVTTAKMALPLLGQLFEQWPTPEALSQGISGYWFQN